jgi:type I restriction enzyme R subunit
MSNFDYLSTIPEFRLFAQAAIEAEKVYKTSAAMCALGTRKALELGVKWVYSADETIQEPYRDNLMSLIHEESFRFSMERGTWVQLLYIVRLGNSAAHSETSVTAGEAVTALKGLFEFVQWIEYCYCKEYTPRTFDESLIPKDTVALDRKKILQQQSLLEEKAGVIENLRAQIAEMSEKLTARKEVNETKQTFVDEMNNVLKQKRDDLYLLDKRITIDTSLEPEFMYAYQFDSTDKSHPTFESQKKVFKHYQDKKYIDGVNYAYNKRILWLNEGDYTLKGKGEL